MIPTTTDARSTTWSAVEERIVAALPWLTLLLSFAVTLAVYGRALGFSYFLDDAIDLSKTDQAAYWSLLAHGVPDAVYYRPVPYMIWKTIHSLTGGYNPVILHAIPIVAHALSGWLLFLLLRRVTGSLWSL